MHRLSVGLAIGLSVSACGPAFSGKVSGYALEPRETLFIPLTDRAGVPLAGLVVLSDLQGLCAQLASPAAPPNATLAAFSFARQADGKLLSPDTGEYVVGASSEAATTAAGVFIKSDANGTNSVPRANHVATSGLLEVNQLSLPEGTLTGQLESKFGAQNDEVRVALSAHGCRVDTKTLRSGFLGAALTSASAWVGAPAGFEQSAACAEYVACWRSTGSSPSELENTYGADGTCWNRTQGQADVCTQFCGDGLVSARKAGYCR